MCCFAKAVLHVARTRIFARLTSTGSQLLAYQMEYKSEEPNAMILPLPVALADDDAPPTDEAVRFIDVSEYEEFFDDLETGFPYVAPPSIGCAMPLCDSAAAGGLTVHEVGNFIASFVPSLSDFDRLDPAFVIPKETWDLIPEYSDFGFAVFQLKQLEGKPHPMAFEFPTRLKQVFFPTVHIHDGQVHEEEDFDHVLYLQHAGFDSVVEDYKNYDHVDRHSGFVRSKWPASGYFPAERSQGLVEPSLLVHRTTLRGSLENADRVFAIQGDPLTPHLNWRRLLGYWPWLVAVGGIGWFLNRRSRLIKRKHQLANNSAESTDIKGAKTRDETNT